MLHYASGTPENNEFQVVENQLARQRLFSVHPNHFKPLLRWVDDIRAGMLSSLFQSFGLVTKPWS